MQGCEVTSLQWGAWGGTGMAVVHNLLPRIIKSGLGVLDPIAGMSALLGVVRSAGFGPQLVVSPFDWRKLMAGAKGDVFPVFKEFKEWATPAQRPLAVAAPAHRHVQVDEKSKCHTCRQRTLLLRA